MLSLPHLAILFIIALLVFGPEKLPELARMLGKAMAEFRRVTYDVRKVVEDEMREMEHQARETDLRKREAALAAEKEKQSAALPPAASEPPIDSEEHSILPPEGTVPSERPGSQNGEHGSIAATPDAGPSEPSTHPEDANDVDSSPS
jgi:sec-independent protein translocase protein TatB